MTAQLIFARLFQGRFQISQSALANLQFYIQDTSDKAEAGGVLLGRHIIDSADIIVDSITTPLVGDRQSRFHYFRARASHQAKIDQAWRESAGTQTYLGEWHTHPESNPTSSKIDQVNWRWKLLYDQFSEPLFFIILGTMQVSVWEGYRALQFTRLRQL